MIWLVGAKGMLGREVEALLRNSNFPFYSSDIEVDITDLSSLSEFSATKNIEYIINCSAYTAVDKAEEDKEFAFRINVDGVRNLAITAKDLGAVLIHVSTDYVFPGNSNTPYLETDKRLPLGVYGESKALGEVAIEETLEKHFILRTSWLYGLQGGNFVKTMIRLMNERDQIGVVGDQFGCPTTAKSLAEVMLQIVSSGSKNYGIYHYCHKGVATWFEFAEKIYEYGQKKKLITTECQVRSLTTEEYLTPAKRPKYSVMNTNKIVNEFGIRIPLWEEGLDTYLDEEKSEKF